MRNTLISLILSVGILTITPFFTAESKGKEANSVVKQSEIQKPVLLAKEKAPKGQAPVDSNQAGKKDKDSKAQFVASKNSKVFHKADCRSAARISQENLVSYATREEAIAAGKRPCKQCNP